MKVKRYVKVALFMTLMLLIGTGTCLALSADWKDFTITPNLGERRELPDLPLQEYEVKEVQVVIKLTQEPVCVDKTADLEGIREALTINFKNVEATAEELRSLKKILEPVRGDVNTSSSVLLPTISQLKSNMQRSIIQHSIVGSSAVLLFFRNINFNVIILEKCGIGSSICIRGPAPHILLEKCSVKKKGLIPGSELIKKSLPGMRPFLFLRKGAHHEA